MVGQGRDVPNFGRQVRNIDSASSEYPGVAASPSSACTPMRAMTITKNPTARPSADSMLQIKMTHAHPLRFVDQLDDRGKMVSVLAPGHPTRPARAHETDTWWEDVTHEVPGAIHRDYVPEFRGGWVPSQDEP